MAVALLVLIGLALPVAHLRLGSSDAGVDPPGSTTRNAYHLIAQGFGAGTNGSFLLVAQLPTKNDKAAAERVAATVRADKDFSFVAPPAVSPDGAVATINANPRTGPQDKATTDTLNRLRDDVVTQPLESLGGGLVLGPRPGVGDHRRDLAVG